MHARKHDDSETVLMRMAPDWCACLQAAAQGSRHKGREGKDTKLDAGALMHAMTTCLKRHIQLLAVEQAARAARNLSLRTQIVQQCEMAHHSEEVRYPCA